MVKAMITEQHTKEMLSMAFVNAIAGKAGVNLGNIRVYDYGVDGTFNSVIKFKNRMIDTGPAIDFQLKSTGDWEVKDNCIVYDLKAKNYNDIVFRNTHPDSVISMILILLCLPKDSDSWLEITEEMLIMKKCCYWYYIKDQQSENTGSVRVKIPISNFLNSEVLTTLIKRMNLNE